MQRKEILSLLKSLIAVENLGGAKFAYAVARNIKKLRREVDVLVKLSSPSPEVQKFDQERAELAKFWSEKDEKGEPKTAEVNGQLEYVISNQDLFKKGLDDLKEVYKQAIGDYELQREKYGQSMNDEIEVDLHRIDPTHLPNDISAKQIEGILPIINEEN